MKVRVYHVNAFTANKKNGNPAGVVVGADNLSDSQMLSIAKQVGFSETAFISQSSIATSKIRFFTPTNEVDLCGHATIASWAMMLKLEEVVPGEYTQETKAGVLKVNVSAKAIYMQQAKAVFYDIVGKEKIAEALRINVEDFDSRIYPEIVSTGLKDIIVLVRSKKVLSSINPDLKAISKLSENYDVSGMHVFCLLQDRPSLLVARNFAPLCGIDEEAATGTSNGATLCYLKKHNLLPNKPEYRIEQGITMHKPSYIYGKFEDDIVWVGGETTEVKQFSLDV